MIQKVILFDSIVCQHEIFYTNYKLSMNAFLRDEMCDHCIDIKSIQVLYFRDIRH